MKLLAFFLTLNDIINLLIAFVLLAILVVFAIKYSFLNLRDKLKKRRHADDNCEKYIPKKLPVPDFIRNAKSGDIVATKYDSIIMVEHVEIDEYGRIALYYYFDYSKSVGLDMNEWLTGFYGKNYDEGFYRQATDEEKKLFLDMIEEFGYELKQYCSDMIPSLTESGYRKFYPCRFKSCECKEGGKE